MELIMILLIYVAFFAALQSTCSSLQVQVQSSHQQAFEVEQLSLPRKLMRITKEMNLKRNEAQNAIPEPNNKQPIVDSITSSSGKGSKNQKVMTWHEWSEGVDTSEYFTMDYTRVKRRRPIHNKSLPP